MKTSKHLIRTPEILKRVTKEIIEDYARSNTRYLELRSTPREYGEIFSTEYHYIGAIYDAIFEAEDEIPTIKVAYIISIDNLCTEDEVDDFVDLVERYKEKAMNEEY